MYTMKVILQLSVSITLLQVSLSFCPYKCDCNNEMLEVSCFQTNLEVMPMTLNPNIQILILNENNFHSVDASLSFYPDLKLLDLSSNQLVSIPDRSFSNQRRLIELRIESNKISELSDRTLLGLTQLQVLSLEHNFIEVLPNKVFRHLRKLKELNLRGNRISEIGNRAFAALSELRILDLSDNLLSTIPTTSLTHLSNLVELSLSHNNIKLIPDLALLNMFKLSVLDLSANKIETIHQKSFTEVTLVRQLHLQDNQLYQVPSEAFKSFSQLEDLIIGQNMFTYLGKRDFLYLTSLNKLDISGCQELEEVKANTFSELYNLEDVRISSNKKLEVIHPEAFGPLPNIKSLDLSNNALSTLSPSLVPWAQLSHLDISGNPWQCDCENSFMKNVIINTINNSDYIRRVNCWDPINLRGRDILTVDLHCEHIQSYQTEQIVRNSEFIQIVAVICSFTVIFIIMILFLIIKFKNSLHSCLQFSFIETDSIPVHSGKILQYEPYQEPSYVSHYLVVKTDNTSPECQVTSEVTKHVGKQYQYSSDVIVCEDTIYQDIPQWYTSSIGAKHPISAL